MRIGSVLLKSFDLFEILKAAKFEFFVAGTSLCETGFWLWLWFLFVTVLIEDKVFSFPDGLCVFLLPFGLRFHYFLVCFSLVLVTI